MAVVVSFLSIHDDFNNTCTKLGIKENRNLVSSAKEIYFGSCMEFYHAMSHLFMTYDINEKDSSIEKAVSHINRAMLDISKILVYFIKSSDSDESFAIDCRISEIIPF